MKKKEGKAKKRAEMGYCHKRRQKRRKGGQKWGKVKKGNN